MVVRTICATKTQKKAIDFRSNLVASGVDHFAELHGTGGNKGARKSTIKVVLCDYSEGTGKGKSHTVEANLAIDTMAKLYEVAKQAILPKPAVSGMMADNNLSNTLAQAKDAASTLYKTLYAQETLDKKSTLAGLAKVGQMIASAQTGIKPAAPDHGPEYTYSQTRVNTYAMDKATNIAPVSLLSVSRRPVRQDGQISRNPWSFKVTNGKAKASFSDIGGVNYERNSFQKEEEVSVIISDDDMFRMMDACRRYITVWENGLISQVLDGIQQMDAEFAAAHQSKQF